MARELDDAWDAPALAHALLEAAPEAILVVGPRGIIKLVNRRAEQMFGYTRSELVGNSVEMLVPIQKRAMHADLVARYESKPTVRAMGELAAVDAQCKNGATLPVEISLSPAETSLGKLTIAIVRDVTRRREFENQLRHAYTHDFLTGLYNRTYLEEVRTKLEAQASPIAVLIIDVDRLKTLNDEFGHEAGDAMLRRMARVLGAAAGPDGLAARLGGDEFALLIPHANQRVLEDAVIRVRAELLVHNLHEPGPALEFSLGAALSERSGCLAEAMRVADQRMYDDKRSRRVFRGAP